MPKAPAAPTRPATKPTPARRPEGADEASPQFEPLYNVVLIDDDDHTYQYVISMLCTLFRMGFEMAYMMACAVDSEGRVVVHTADRDEAASKRDQIRSFGPDPLLLRSTRSMHAVIEPLTGG